MLLKHGIFIALIKRHYRDSSYNSGGFNSACKTLLKAKLNAIKSMFL